VSDETYNAALSAFEALDTEEVDPLANQPISEGEQVDTGTPPESPPAPTEPASKEIDISGLPEEAQIFLRAREREMQGDYTRKTQEIAAQRAEAEQAMQFLSQLNSDPEFANQVLNHLQSNLAAAGYQVAPEQVEYVDEYGQPAEPDPYQQEIADIQQWRAQMENDWKEANLSAGLDRQLATIQAQHTDWTEEDLQDVIDLGFATNGDLIRAAEIFQAQSDRHLSRYLEKKGSVNTPAPLPSSPAQPVPFQPKSDQELRDAAMERIRSDLG